MERVKDEPIKVYINDFEMVIDNTLDELEITDRYKIPASQWSYCLMRIYDQIIKPNNIELLKVKNNLKNEYDYNKLVNIYELYKSLCIKYVQVVNITDLCILYNMQRSTLYRLSDEKLNSGRYNILENIKEYNEKTLISTQQARGYNPILTMAQLNKNHGYNGAGTSNERERRQIQTLDNAPQLLPQSTPKTIEQQ